MDDKIWGEAFTFAVMNLQLDTNTIILGLVSIALIVFVIYYFMGNRKKDKEDELSYRSPERSSEKPDSTTTALKLQAYERLVILAERIALPNLIARVSQPGLDKMAMQHLLTETIKQEYEHNLSQQIYVTPEIWTAVRNLKEQNIYLINQVASILPVDTSGQELNKRILEVSISQPQYSMHNIVQEAVSFEAKKLLK